MLDLVWAFHRTAPHIDDILASRTGASIVPTLPNRADCETRRAPLCHAAVAQRVSLSACPKTATTLVQRRLQKAPRLTNQLLRVH